MVFVEFNMILQVLTNQFEWNIAYVIYNDFDIFKAKNLIVMLCRQLALILDIYSNHVF